MNKNKQENNGPSLKVRVFCLVLAGLMIFGVAATVIGLLIGA